MRKGVINVHFLLFSPHCRKGAPRICSAELAWAGCCVVLFLCICRLSVFSRSRSLYIEVSSKSPASAMLHLWLWTQGEGWKEPFWGNELIKTIGKLWRGIKIANMAMTNHTALPQSFPSHVVTLRWDLQGCEFQEEQEFTKVWEQKRFRSYLCHGKRRHKASSCICSVKNLKWPQEAELHKSLWRAGRSQGFKSTLAAGR